MLAGAAVVTTAGVIPRVVVTAVFVGGGALGGFLSSLLSTHFHLPPRRVLLVLLALELACIGALWLAGMLLLPTLTSINSPNVTFVGALAALAMGVQASAVKECLPGTPSTTVMTTTLTNTGALLGATLDAALRAAGALPSPLPQQARRAALTARALALAHSCLPIAAFVCGVCLGAALQIFISFHSCCVPTAVLLLLIALLALPKPAEDSAGGAAAAAAATSGASLLSPLTQQQGPAMSPF